MVLFGRDKEIARVLALIRSPRESAMTVTGGHGSGKSSLLAEIAKWDEYRTVLLRANPSESSWPFSGLTALLNGIDDPALAPLTDYVATSPRGNLDAADISTMLLSALRQWSADRTVVVIDDAEQLDPASQTVLGFLARRLAGTGLVLIASMRGEAPESPFARLATLQLENLSLSDAVRMLEAITPGVGSTAVIHAVAAATHGNPLASINLYNQLMQRQLQGQYALPVPLHWNGSFEPDLAASISAFSPRGRGHLTLFPFLTGAAPLFWRKCPGTYGRAWMNCLRRDRRPNRLAPQHSESMLRAHVVSAMRSAEEPHITTRSLQSRKSGSTGLAVALELHRPSPGHVVHLASPRH